jgi:hypothetical protein
VAIPLKLYVTGASLPGVAPAVVTMDLLLLLHKREENQIIRKPRSQERGRGDGRTEGRKEGS